MAFARSGLSIATVASRLEWPPYKVRRLLSGKAGLLKIRHVGEMAFAIDGAVISFSLSQPNGETK